MICENFLCIYEDEGKCILDEIELDVMGQCTMCEYINISDSTLKPLKKEALSHYNK